jgi:nucleoside-diphosphate kinase
VSPSVVAQGGLDGCRSLFEVVHQVLDIEPGKRLAVGSRQGFVQVVHIGLMVLVVVQVECFGVENGLERGVVVGEGRKGVGHRVAQYALGGDFVNLARALTGGPWKCYAKGIMIERSFTMIRHDMVAAGKVGAILERFERAGLKLVAMKLTTPSKKLLETHYPATPELLKRLGANTVTSFAAMGRDVVKEFGSNDPEELGKLVRSWLIDWNSLGPVVAMVWEGNNAVKNIRRLVGPTIPMDAPAGTIRGDFSIDSPDLANGDHRPLHNVIHASGNSEEAAFEVGLWFPELKK